MNKLRIYKCGTSVVGANGETTIKLVGVKFESMEPVYILAGEPDKVYTNDTVKLSDEIVPVDYYNEQEVFKLLINQYDFINEVTFTELDAHRDLMESGNYSGLPKLIADAYKESEHNHVAFAFIFGALVSSAFARTHEVSFVNTYNDKKIIETRYDNILDSFKEDKEIFSTAVEVCKTNYAVTDKWLDNLDRSILKDKTEEFDVAVATYRNYTNLVNSWLTIVEYLDVYLKNLHKTPVTVAKYEPFINITGKDITDDFGPDINIINLSPEHNEFVASLYDEHLFAVHGSRAPELATKALLQIALYYSVSASASITENIEALASEYESASFIDVDGAVSLTGTDSLQTLIKMDSVFASVLSAEAKILGLTSFISHDQLLVINTNNELENMVEVIGKIV